MEDVNKMKTAVLSIDNHKDCFVTLSEDVRSCFRDIKGLVFELSNSDVTVYVTATGESCQGQSIVKMNGLFADKQKLKNKEEVMLRRVTGAQSCLRVYLEPLSIDDWEILEMHAGFVENNLLNQIRVVWPGQVFPVWVQKSICIFVKTGEVEPVGPCAVLEERTEVVVTPKDRRHGHTSMAKKSMRHATEDNEKATTGNEGTPENVQHAMVGTQHATTKANHTTASTHKAMVNKNQATESEQGVTSRTEKENFAKAVDERSQSEENSSSGLNARKENGSNKRKKHTRFADNMDGMGGRSGTRSGGGRREEGAISHGLFGSVWNYFKSLWGEDSNQAGETPAETHVSNFLDRCWVANLRIQQFGAFLNIEQIRNKDNNLVDIKPINLVQQPSIVYINRATFDASYKDCTQKCHTSPFLASMTFLPSPSQKEQLLKRQMEKSSQKTTRTPESSPLTTSSDAESCDHNSDVTKVRTIVRVIVLEDNTYRLFGNNGVELGRAQLPGDSGVSDGHVMISDQLRRQLALDVTGRVMLTSLRQDSEPCMPKTLSLHPLFEKLEGFTLDMLVTAFRCWVLDCCDVQLPLVVGLGTLVTVPVKPDFEGEFLLSFSPDGSQQLLSPHPYTLLHRHLVEKMRITVEEQLTTLTRPPWLIQLPCLSTRQLDPELPSTSLDQLGGIEDLVSAALQHTELCLCQRPLARHFGTANPGVGNGGLLICGGRGVGRTSLAKALCRKLTQPPNQASAALVECKQLRGKRVDGILKTLERVFSEAAWRQPSVVVLDDLDIICGSPSGPEQEMSGDAIYFSRVSQVVRDLLKAEMREHTLISVIATCENPGAIHETLSAPQGLHIFQQIIEIKPPNKLQRTEILRKLIERHDQIDDVSSSDVDLTSLVTKTEGFVARDLEQVLQRAVHTHAVLNPESSRDVIRLTDGDLDVALNGFTPASLKNASLHLPAEVSWADVGGLHEVRGSLVETLQWPAKYPELFASCPLRLRSGLLLYGAPGTGKTLLASVVAKECGLNFISIKGPELLSKYIGASEQAVRDTFLRAQSAKPCILFFDEFDSLAPRRGHDSTGVTDRVVNQLLTQLDGVEALDGVYVLAATSRPDLIDPALLRPGRLDKALHCTLPNEEERIEILTSLTRHMTLADDVTLADIARACGYFTGADFKALLYNAQLGAIHEQYGVDFGGPSPTPQPEVTGCEKGADTMQALSDDSVTEECDVTKRTKNSDSETSVTSNSSWEALSAPLRDIGSELVVIERPLSKSSLSLTYIPSLEDGVAEISEEQEHSLREQVSSLLLGPAQTGSSEEPSQSSTVVIHQRHLDEALKGMGPSVSPAERAKFEYMSRLVTMSPDMLVSRYENFVASKGSDFTEMTSSVGKRATLA